MARLSPVVTTAKKDHKQQFFSLVVNDDDQLTIGLDKLNVIGPVSVTWLANGEVVVKDNVSVGMEKKTKNNEEDEECEILKLKVGLVEKYKFENCYSGDGKTKELCTTAKLFVNEVINAKIHL